ncbi:DNA gyrase inhibitor YacG [Sphingobium sp. CCH11-B1]|jgi:endogenous inhibitor of DNA gyrase (YacG/DUF329 family)|uniref:DNA gyrase inhibitor YacG n=1 Tax=Sphingobium sp. CCH11-B1 TaxID=1768781 RepID=UPI00082F6F21|nr:DNA gyrase inhibitor YacG [Sphingobium sp. CCH11-B1]MEA3391337.1 DNA gyrase inhibitor YacG [Pseudomonadota bacterium]
MSPKPASCPICGQSSQPASRPFCSPACRDRDLLQWLGDGYRVPGASADLTAQKNGDEGLDSEAD